MRRFVMRPAAFRRVVAVARKAGGASSIRYSRSYVIARSNSAVWCGSWCG